MLISTIFSIFITQIILYYKQDAPTKTSHNYLEFVIIVLIIHFTNFIEGLLYAKHVAKSYINYFIYFS